jgi:hypothetical protein
VEFTLNGPLINKISAKFSPGEEFPHFNNLKRLFVKKFRLSSATPSIRRVETK